MDIIVFASLISFFIAFVTMPLIIRVADAKQLLDMPGDRKVHFVPIPALGGIGLYLAISLCVLTASDFSSAPELQYFSAGSLVIFFLGLKDDLHRISPLQKFAGQCLSVFIISFQGHYQLSSFHGFLGIESLPASFSTAFTYLTMLVIINAFNLIDGIDGLAGTLALVSTLFFGTVFAIEMDYAHATLAFSTAAALLGFMIYNYSPARIFLGDTGSLLIGLINAVLAIRFINLETGSDTVLQFPAAPALAFSALFVPLADTLRVILIRIYFGRSPFHPDVNHIHHMLLEKGFSHLQITGILGIVSMVILAFAAMIQPLGINAVIFSVFAVGFSLVGLLHWSLKRGKKETRTELQKKASIH